MSMSKLFKYDKNSGEHTTGKLYCGLNLVMSELGMVDIWQDRKLIASLDTHNIVRDGKWSGDLEQLTEALVEANKHLAKRNYWYVFKLWLAEKGIIK